MNYVLYRNKNMNEYSEFIESEYKVEYLNIEDDAFEPQSNALNEFSYFKVPSYDLKDVYDDQISSSKNIAKKHQDEDDMLCWSNFKSTCLLHESSINVINEKNTMSAKMLDLSMVNYTAENAKEEYSEAVDLDSIRWQLSPKILCPKKNNLDVFPNQDELHMIQNKTNNHNSESSGYKRWGRKEDIKTFKTLRELWNLEGIPIETFWSRDSTLTEKHHYILLKLVHQHNWKRNTHMMLKRIQSLGKNQAMSVREQQLFARLNKKAKKENKALKLEEIAHLFPGKSISTLEIYIKP